MDSKTCDNTKICCDAKNCVYHEGDCTCTAESIKVGSRNACTCADTNCATFRLKNEAMYKT